MITKFTIFGERCSGTNYLEEIIKSNFEIEITWDYGWKHFFGFNNYINTDNVLFIGIIRNPFDWINSLFIDKHHLASHLKKNIRNYLNDEFWSIHDKSELGEIMEDRNIFSKERYKNIFELRFTKIKYLLEILPTKVQSCIIIRYEDLIHNFENTINKIKNCGLTIKNNIEYPININRDCKYSNTYNKDIKKYKKHIISKQVIINNPNINLYYERMLNYI
jgi:hypothetical protein